MVAQQVPGDIHDVYMPEVLPHTHWAARPVSVMRDALYMPKVMKQKAEFRCNTWQAALPAPDQGRRIRWRSQDRPGMP